MQVHWKTTTGAKKYRKWYYGNRNRQIWKDKKETEKKTRLDVLNERRKRWEESHETIK